MLILLVRVRFFIVAYFVKKLQRITFMPRWMTSPLSATDTLWPERLKSSFFANSGASRFPLMLFIAVGVLAYPVTPLPTSTINVAPAPVLALPTTEGTRPFRNLSQPLLWTASNLLSQFWYMSHFSREFFPDHPLPLNLSVFSLVILSYSIMFFPFMAFIPICN